MLSFPENSVLLSRVMIMEVVMMIMMVVVTTAIAVMRQPSSTWGPTASPVATAVKFDIVHQAVAVMISWGQQGFIVAGGLMLL